MHHTSNHAAALVRFGDLLSILQQQSSLQNMSISPLAQVAQPSDGLEVPTARQGDSSCQITNPVAREHSAIVTHSREDQMQSPKRHLLSLNISLPLWLTRMAWHLAVCESQGSWTIKINLINLRPSDAVVFDYVTRGDTMIVRRLLDAGELSIKDQTDEYSGGFNILDVGQLPSYIS